MDNDIVFINRSKDRHPNHNNWKEYVNLELLFECLAVISMFVIAVFAAET